MLAPPPIRSADSRCGGRRSPGPAWRVVARAVGGAVVVVRPAVARPAVVLGLPAVAPAVSVAAVLASGAVAVAGCGSAAVDALPPAATPSAGPSPRVAPLGRVVPVDGTVTGLAFAGGHVVVAADGPPRLLLLDPSSGATVRSVALPGRPGRPAVAGDTLVVPVEGQIGLVALRADDGAPLADLTAPGPVVAAAPLGAGATGASGAARAAGETKGSDPSVSVATLEPRGALVSETKGSDPFVSVAALDPRGALVVRWDGREVQRATTEEEPSDLSAVKDGRLLAVLSGRARTLELFATRYDLDRVGRLDVGAGPARLASAADYVFVTDSAGDALLVVRARPTVELERRVTLPGGPFAIALDPGQRRLWVTLPRTNELAELPATRRPRIIQRVPSLRGPSSVTVDPATGRVFVAGAQPGLQVFDPPEEPPKR